MKTVMKTMIIGVDVCDCCGGSLSEEDNHERSCVATFDFGYYSDRDGDRGTFNFCEKCSLKVLEALSSIVPDMKLVSILGYST